MPPRALKIALYTSLRPLSAHIAHPKNDAFHAITVGPWRAQIRRKQSYASETSLRHERVESALIDTCRNREVQIGCQTRTRTCT